MIHLSSLNLAIILIPRCGSMATLRSVERLGLGGRVKRGRAQARHRPSNRSHGLPGHHAHWLPPNTKIAAFVRHPVTWYESWWAYSRYGRGQKGDKTASDWSSWHPAQYIAGLYRDKFNDAMRLMLAREPAHVTRRYEWYCGPEHAETVDFIGRQEYLAEHLERVLRLCGYAGEFPPMRRINKSRRHRVKWDAGIKREVLAIEAVAIRRFYEDDGLTILGQNKKGDK